MFDAIALSPVFSFDDSTQLPPLGQVYQPFHLFKFTMFPTQVSCVSIDRRDSPRLCLAQRCRYIVGGLLTSGSALPNADHLPLALVSKCVISDDTFTR